jgi:hypothetical protein
LTHSGSFHREFAISREIRENELKREREREKERERAI